MIANFFPDDEPLLPLAARIMRHVNRYKVSFPAAMRRVLLPKGELNTHEGIGRVDRAIAKFVERRELCRLQGSSVLAKNLIHLPGHDVKSTDISRVWWCCMERERRHIVTYEELKPLFAAEQIPAPFHNYCHCLYRAVGGAVLARLYHCNAEKKNAREQIRRHLTQNSKKFLHWIDEGSYRLAVLVVSDARKTEIKKLIHETYRSSPSLSMMAGITVSVIPTEQTFAGMLAQYLERELDGR